MVFCSPRHIARVHCVQSRSLEHSFKTMQRTAKECQLMYLCKSQSPTMDKTFSLLQPKQVCRSTAASRLNKALMLHQQAASHLSQHLQMLLLTSWRSSVSKVRLWSFFLSRCQTRPGAHTGGQKAQSRPSAFLLKVDTTHIRKLVQLRVLAARQHIPSRSGQWQHRSSALPCRAPLLLAQGQANRR